MSDVTPWAECFFCEEEGFHHAICGEDGVRIPCPVCALKAERDKAQKDARDWESIVDDLIIERNQIAELHDRTLVEWEQEKARAAAAEKQLATAEFELTILKQQGDPIAERYFEDAEDLPMK